jgi:hypothetical protein
MIWRVERQKKSLVRTNYIVVYDMMMMIHFNPLDYQILASHFLICCNRLHAGSSWRLTNDRLPEQH